MAEIVSTERVYFKPVDPNNPNGDGNLVLPKEMMQEWPRSPKGDFRNVSIEKGIEVINGEEFPTFILIPVKESDL